MIRCDLVTAPATAADYLCRAECGRVSNYVLKARDYPYSYPCCSNDDCMEKVLSRMKGDIERNLPPAKEPSPWWRFQSGRNDPYLT